MSEPTEAQLKRLYRIYEDINLSTYKQSKGEPWSQSQIEVCGMALQRFWDILQELGVEMIDPVECEDKL